MKLVLDEQDVKEILLKEANNLFLGYNFNNVELDLSYGNFKKAEIERIEKEETPDVL